MAFIKVQGQGTDETYHINISQITHIGSLSGVSGTLIYFGPTSITVRESAEEIIDLIDSHLPAADRFDRMMKKVRKRVEKKTDAKKD